MKETRIGPSQFAVLGMLTLRPMSGYDVKQTIEQSIAHFWGESFGQIYPSLKRLVAAGMITGKASRSKSQAGREKHTYAITAKGRKEFENWLGVAPREQPPRSELLLKVFFAAEVPVEVTLAHVSALRERQLKMLAVYGGVEKQLERVHRNNPKLPFWLMTLSFGRHRSQAMVDWCDETLKKLAKMLPSEGVAV